MIKKIYLLVSFLLFTFSALAIAQTEEGKCLFTKNPMHEALPFGFEIQSKIMRPKVCGLNIHDLQIFSTEDQGENIISFTTTVNDQGFCIYTFGYNMGRVFLPEEEIIEGKLYHVIMDGAFCGSIQYLDGELLLLE